MTYATGGTLTEVVVKTMMTEEMMAAVLKGK